MELSYTFAVLKACLIVLDVMGFMFVTALIHNNGYAWGTEPPWGFCPNPAFWFKLSVGFLALLFLVTLLVFGLDATAAFFVGSAVICFIYWLGLPK